MEVGVEGFSKFYSTISWAICQLKYDDTSSLVNYASKEFLQKVLNKIS